MNLIAETQAIQELFGKKHQYRHVFFFTKKSGLRSSTGKQIFLTTLPYLLKAVSVSIQK